MSKSLSRHAPKLFALHTITAVSGFFIFAAANVDAETASKKIADGTYTITSACNGKQLGLSIAAPTPGANAVLRESGSVGAIDWQITETSDGSSIVRAAGTESALQTSYEQIADESNVDLWTYWGSSSQRWFIADSEDGTFKLSFAAATGMALDAKYSGANGETEVWLHTAADTCAQRWRFKKVTVKSDNKKLLETGWDTPPPWFIKQNIVAMQARPFDGLMVRSSVASEVFTRVASSDQGFARDRGDLEALDWGRFTDNFLVLMSGTPAGWDWFNDADWAASEANARQFARVAKAGKLKGVLFDSEPYLNNPWRYAQQPGAANYSFAQYQAKVRERGKRFMQVLQEEYPGLQVMTYYGMSLFTSAIQDKPDNAVLQARLQDDTYGMWANFLNGMIEAAEAATNITDGNEFAYYNFFADTYDAQASLIRNDLLVLVDAPLRTKYAAQMKVGQAIYADGVMNLWGSPRFCGYYFQNDADRLKQLEHNVYHSLRSADRYAWFYNENMDWWGSKGDGVKIPSGMTEAINSAREKIANGQSLGFDLQATSTAAKDKCNSRRFVGGKVSYPDGNAGLTFDVLIDGKREGRYACTPYNGDQSYDCVIPAGSTAIVTPVKPGYRFEPASRSYGTSENNLWSENFTAIKQ